MTSTILPISLTTPRPGQLAATTEPTFIAEWQDGLETVTGLRQRKLRLTFATEKSTHGPQIPTWSFPFDFLLPTIAQGTTLGLSAIKERI